MRIYPSTLLSPAPVAVGVASLPFTTVLAPGQIFQFVSSTNCYLRQGTAMLITCPAKASLVDTDQFTVVGPDGTTTYEFDVSNNGASNPRQAPAPVLVNVSTDTTAATVATRLRTAMLAAQPSLVIVDNADGTLTVVAPGALSMTENVANAGFLVAAATLVATAGAGSMFWPANVPVLIDGALGATVAVIQAAAGGFASLTRCKVYP